MSSPLLAERVAAAARAQPEAVAIRDGAETLTYADLSARVDAVARAVAGRGRVAVLPRADAGSLAAVVGAMAAGTSVVLLDRHVSARQVERVLAVARPALVVASGRLPPALDERLDAVRRRRPAELVAEGGARDRPAPRARPGDELLVGMTSGTSGEPKLFVRDQASWATTLDRSDAAFDVRPGDVVWAGGPLDHGHFLYGALHALTRGATVDLRPLAEAATSDAITHLYLVPTLGVDLVDLLGERRLRRVREVVSSAAPWPPAARRRLAERLPHAAISHFYGASELSFVALSTTRDPTPDPEAARPFPGVQIEIRDADGTPLPAGRQGIVHVRSDMLFAGYLDDEGAMRDGPDADGWTTVGDLGTLRDGWLTLAGRHSDTIISGGFNVEPAQVETALAELPGVREAACVGLPDRRWGALPVAVLVVDDAAAPTAAQVRRHARATLPQPSRPRRVFVADALPRSPRGKLRRDALVELVAAGGARELR